MEISVKSFGDNLNEWFRAMGRTWKPLLVLCALVYIPVGLLTTALFLLPGVRDAYVGLILLESESPDPDQVLELLIPLLGVGLIWGVLNVLATLVIYVAASRAVALTASGHQPFGLEVLRFGASRLATGVAAAFVIFFGLVLIGAGAALIGWILIASFGVDFFPVFVTTVTALTAIVTVVWLMVSVSLFPIAIALEDVGPAQALVSSFRLVQGRWWPTLGFVLLTGLIVSAASQVLSIALVPLLLLGTVVPAFLALGYGLATMLQGPVTAVMALAYSVWYIDLRAREGPLTTEQLVGDFE